MVLNYSSHIDKFRPKCYLGSMGNVINVSVKKFLSWAVGPFEENPWVDEPPLAVEEIAQAIRENNVEENPWNLVAQADALPPRAHHVRRVAYFVVNGWPDPIDVDFGCPSLGFHESNPIQDGWHRLAAAIYRKDKYIRCAWSGEQTEARKFLFRGKA